MSSRGDTATAAIGPEGGGRVRSRSDGPSTLRGRHDDPGSQAHDPAQPQGQVSISGSNQVQAGNRYHGSKAWWSVGEFLHQGITHQSVGLSLRRNEEETWDLSDSLADLYQAVTQRQRQKNAQRTRGHSRSESGGAIGGRESDMSQDIRRWLDEDTSNGYIRVFASDADTHARLFPCTLSTSAQKICLQMGIPGNSLHVQLNGDVIRRMEPFDCPLAIQNEYLAGLGYSDIRYIQEEGPKEDLAYLVRFYAGKPLSDFTYARNQLSTYAYVRKGKLLHQWTRRLCVISGTRLLIYREKGAEPTAVQLAKGSVEEVMVKGQSNVLKLTSTLQGERSLYMAFESPEDYSNWLKKIRKATAKLPGKADLSNCHLEFLPETVFINTELEILILRHNALKERPIEEDIYTIGWLDDLPRFNCLRSLNLADNQLSSFPVTLTAIRSLVELNLASNQLEDVPTQISELVNLKVLHLHNNLLSSLPEELGQMKHLAVVVLAFNKFTHIPPFLLQSQMITCKLDSVIMAGNQIGRLPAEQLPYMSHIKKIDLRLNRLQLLPTEMAKFQNLEHVTHVDIRENQVKDLDARAIRQLAYINCERNNMRSMQLNGSSLKNVFASHNCIQTLSINPKPEWLVSMDVSYNKLVELPSWLPDCFFLVNLDVSHNSLKELPERLFTDGRRLKVVKANHNRLTSIPEKIHTDTLEELHLQHNMIRHLSPELFLKTSRLRYLNVTRNKLCDLPPPNQNVSFNKLQELYMSFNHLANRALEKICCFPRLRVLHMARNKISVMEETDIEKLEQLSELNVSSNNLTYLPSSLGRHPKLQVIRANCNLLQELPNFKNSSGLKVLEVSSNHLVNVDMSNLMASQVSLLDISANPSILVKSHDIEMAKKRLCMLDMRGQNWSVEDLRPQTSVEEDDVQRWQTGLSQTSGIRNKLSVTAINKPHFNESGTEALFAVFDGGRNETVAGLLCDIMPTTLREEKSKDKDPGVYLKYSFLSAHRNLKSKGQKLGASAVIAYIHKDDRGQDVLSVANVGDSQAVLCRQRRAYVLSRPFVVAEDTEDTRRVVQAGGIVTEDGRVSGVTYNTRLLGCSYLFPHVTPDPHVTSTVLTPEDTVLVVANQGLWNFVSYDEAIREIKDTPDPIVAAKRLQDLAQGYGSRENIAVLVVRLMLSSDERSRMKDLMRVQRKAQKELLKVLSPHENLLQLRDGVPKVEELNDVVIDKYGHAKKGKTSSRKTLYSEDSLSRGSSMSNNLSQNTELQSSTTHSSHHNSTQSSSLSVSNSAGNRNSDISPVSKPKKLKQFHSVDNQLQENGSPPRQTHYRKKNAVTPQSSLESMMRKRISEDLKTKELLTALCDSTDDDTSSCGGGFNNKNISSNSHKIRPSETDSQKEMTNWVAKKPQEVKRATNTEGWEELLQQRLTQELADREMKQIFLDGTEDDTDTDISASSKSNWVKRHEHQNKSPSSFQARTVVKPLTGSIAMSTDSTSLNTPKADTESTLLSKADSTDTINSDVVRMIGSSSHSSFAEDDYGGHHSDTHDDFGDDSNYDKPVEETCYDNDEDFEEDRFSVSPSESVSSIDLRLHNEADEIYRLRYFNPHHQGLSTSDLPLPPPPDVSSRDQIYEDESENMYPPPPQFSSNNNVHKPSSVMTDPALSRDRPLSPSSLISQDEFVKPPISTANIDRDALLFHQMQMARAQAHAGSLASLDSVQSAPIHISSRREAFPQAKVSSHSIEVLVNVGEEGEAVSSAGHRGSRQRSHGSQDNSLGDSSSTITGSRGRDLNVSNDMIASEHEMTANSRSKLSSRQEVNSDSNNLTSDNSGAYIVSSSQDDEADEDDKDTLICDEDDDDIANLADVTMDQTSDGLENNYAGGLDVGTSKDVKKNSRNGVQSSNDVDFLSGAHPEVKSIFQRDIAVNDIYDSDSDESIGNVSLGDGYTAIEFPTNNARNGSLSMLNVLESEAEDYPDVFLRNKIDSWKRQNGSNGSKLSLSNGTKLHGSKGNIFISTKGSSQASQKEETMPDENHSNKHLETSLHHSLDDYEDIEDQQEVLLKETFVDNTIDDYEDVQYSPSELSSSNDNAKKTPQTEQSTEEDIDALYAKVNKIKMQKMHDKINIENVLIDSDKPSVASVNKSLQREIPLKSNQSSSKENIKQKVIFHSASDLIQSPIVAQPPLPPKPKTVFSNDKRHSPQLVHGKDRSTRRPSKESVRNQLSVQVSHSSSSSSSASSPFCTPKSSPTGTHKLHSNFTDHVTKRVFSTSGSIDSNTSVGSNKPPSPRSSINTPSSDRVISLSQGHTNKPPPPHLETKPPSASIRSKPPSPSSLTGHPARQDHTIPPPPLPHRTRSSPPPLPPKQPFHQPSEHTSPQTQTQRPPFPLRPQNSFPQTHHHFSSTSQTSQRHQGSSGQSQKQHSYPPQHHNHSVPEQNKQQTNASLLSKPKISKKPSRAPPYPPPPIPTSPHQLPSNNVQSHQSQVPPSDPPPHHNNRRSLPPGRATIAFPHVEDNGEDDIDNSVLSAHELYPDAHYPTSTHLPNSAPYPNSNHLPNSAHYPAGASHLPSNSDITAAARQLSTQRSIIITYL